MIFLTSFLAETAAETAEETATEWQQHDPRDRQAFRPRDALGGQRMREGH